MHHDEQWRSKLLDVYFKDGSGIEGYLDAEAKRSNIKSSWIRGKLLFELSCSEDEILVDIIQYEKDYFEAFSSQQRLAKACHDLSILELQEQVLRFTGKTKAALLKCGFRALVKVGYGIPTFIEKS